MCFDCRTSTWPTASTTASPTRLQPSTSCTRPIWRRCAVCWGPTHLHTDGRLHEVMTGFLTSRVWRTRLPRNSAMPARKFAKARSREVVGMTKAAVHGGPVQLPAALAGAQAAHDFDPDVLEEDLRTLCGDALRRTALSSFGPGPNAWENRAVPKRLRLLEGPPQRSSRTSIGGAPARPAGATSPPVPTRSLSTWR